ncbi:regulator of nonsense transcripts 3A isoform X2 [Prionailurus bengalensis]|uniref:regulator of nonsense transcripts 3A isoform X2 n=1 Tax=Prionailurus bengalensis TaxID=37029 RepID=UPI001CA81C78|nr:regulator of nonsense transcripts 3A isoform X2 [Prionailurus bengalensis]
MRSEKEGAGGPGAAVAARGPSGREKPSAVEVQFRRESPRREPEAPPASFFVCGDGICKHREEKKTVLSKVVIRRLPPSLTKEQLEEQLHPLPAHDYFEFFTADFSLYPHLYSRAYINFRNPDDILLFRDRFDGYIFIDSKGLEYPAVVEFAPFQKIAKKKLKKKDAKTGSIEDDPEYKKFLETYCVEEEKTNANPETLLGDMEAKTRELIARRTTPLLEYIKNRKLEKQRIREEKREERRRRELEKKRLREEEKRKKRDEERCKRKEADKQKRIAERELLKKPEKGEEPTTEKPKERGEEMDTRDGEQESCPGCAVRKPMPLGSSLEEPREKSQNESNEEQRELDRRFREKDPETQRCHLDDSRKQRAHCEFDTFSRRNEEELRWGKGGPPDRGKKGSQDSGNAVEAAERPGKEQRSEGGPAAKTERPGNKGRQNHRQEESLLHPWLITSVSPRSFSSFLNLRIGRPCSCTSQEFASEHEKVVGEPLWSALAGTRTRLKIQHRGVPRRAKRQGKEPIYKMKRQPMERKKISSNNIPNKGLISKIWKEFITTQ